MPSPPPLPENIPLARPLAQPSVNSGRDDLQKVADTIGFVPSLRKGENKLQLIVFLVVAVLTFPGVMIIMLVSTKGDNTELGPAIGLSGIIALFAGFVGVILSGVYLAIRNLFRPGKRH